MEPLRAPEILAEEARADHHAVPADQGTVRAVGEPDSPDAPDHGRVEHAQEHGEDEQHPQGRDELAMVRTSDQANPGRRETPRSRSLMPMNGAMTPPRP